MDDENGTGIQLENIQKKAISDVLLQLKIIANEPENPMFILIMRN